MGSLIEELRRRETAARAAADRLRARIEELTEDLARAEEQVMRLAIAQEEVTQMLEEPAAAEPPAGRLLPAIAGQHPQPGGTVVIPGPLRAWIGTSVLLRPRSQTIHP